VLVCSSSLLIRGPILPAVRQKLHLSHRSDWRGRLFPRLASQHVLRPYKCSISISGHAFSTSADAQPTGRMRRIGILNGGSAASTSSYPFLQGLRELGYAEGQNLAIEFRFVDWQLNRLPALAAELVALRVDVIVAVATPAARAAKQATRTIPIVAVGMGDPVGDELVASLGSPGGNVTGNKLVATGDEEFFEQQSQRPARSSARLEDLGHGRMRRRNRYPPRMLLPRKTYGLGYCSIANTK
jgi:hypothetical protein